MSFFFHSKKYHCLILSKDNTLRLVKKRPGKYHQVSISGQTYYILGSSIYLKGYKRYIFFKEGNPIPLPLQSIINHKNFSPEYDARTIDNIMKTKFVDEALTGSLSNIILIVLGVANILAALVILNKLYGWFQ